MTIFSLLLTDLKIPARRDKIKVVAIILIIEIIQ